MFNLFKLLTQSKKASPKPLLDSDFIAKRNQQGTSSEKKGDIDKAIGIYEELVSLKTDTPHTYKRLAIIYGKQRDEENVRRVVKSALENTSNPTHTKWFENRLKKLDG